jgi:hypothetical protein
MGETKVKIRVVRKLKFLNNPDKKTHIDIFFVFYYNPAIGYAPKK